MLLRGMLDRCERKWTTWRDTDCKYSTSKYTEIAEQFWSQNTRTHALSLPYAFILWSCKRAHKSWNSNFERCVACVSTGTPATAIKMFPQLRFHQTRRPWFPLQTVSPPLPRAHCSKQEHRNNLRHSMISTPKRCVACGRRGMRGELPLEAKSHTPAWSWAVNNGPISCKIYDFTHDDLKVTRTKNRWLIYSKSQYPFC